jgi:hypothetical protein
MHQGFLNRNSPLGPSTAARATFQDITIESNGFGGLIASLPLLFHRRGGGPRHEFPQQVNLLWKELLLRLKLLLSFFVENCSARQLPLDIKDRLLLIKFLSHPLAERIQESIPRICDSPFQFVKLIKLPARLFPTALELFGERIPLPNGCLQLGVVLHRGLLRIRELSGPTSVNPSSHASDRPHHGRIGLESPHQRLHIRADAPRKVMVQERSDIRVLHDQVLFGVANKT